MLARATVSCSKSGVVQVTQQVAQSSEGFPQSSASDFLRQLGFREYARYLSFHFPFTHERSLLEHLRAVPWKYDQRLFKGRGHCPPVYGDPELAGLLLMIDTSLVDCV